MCTLLPLADGRVALYVGSRHIGDAPDRATAEACAREYEQAMRALAPVVWAAGRDARRATAPERRQEWSRPHAEQLDQAA